MCVSNLISLTYLTPGGLVDASKVTGDLVLGYALGSESFVPIRGGESYSPWPGEIIYCDSGSGNVMCRALEQSRRTGDGSASHNENSDH